MRLLLLGASGGCGRWVARLASGQGIAVTAVARHASAARVPPVDRVELGDVLDAEFLRRVVPGHDRVISCLGLRRRHPWNPWSPLASPADFASEATALLAAAMHEAGIERLLTISAAGVGDSAAVLNAPMRWMLRHSTVGAMYHDLERMEDVLRGSGLDWFAARPVTLIDGPPRGKAKVVTRFRATSVISRGEVAKVLLDTAIAAASPTDRTPMLAWR